ncbi:hypothetical protein MKK63_09465 [Methylobacterium sp. J-088]|uniref:hypothetical protein n=1 Tax=Methylobacterium sp. J-088 TaxID=2836664 RepID=UPI001FB88FEE|nr:hypothetical protein [Methylobacterium sp. J-088]MCJ2062937.1 hypothetical protein [Methylobacterium sp. J-088]
MPDNSPPKNLAAEIARKRQASSEMKLLGLSPNSKMLGLFGMNKRVIAVSDEALYEVKMADWIDPERTNPSLNNMQRKISKRGASSPSVSRTILTAEVLSQPGFIRELDREALLGLAMNGALCLSSMDDDSDAISAFEKSVVDNIDGIDPLGVSVVVPYHDVLEARVKSFFQSSIHCLQSLLDISALFYGDGCKKGYFEGLRDYLKHTKKDESFSDYLTRNLDFIKFLREVRNAIEHPKLNKRMVIQNYRLLPSGDIGGPTFELIHPGVAHPEVGLPSFLVQLLDSLATLYEEVLVQLFDNNSGSFGEVKFGVVRIPPDRMRYGSVRYELSITNLPSIAED